MDNKPHIGLLLGTGRDGRQSEHVYSYLLAMLGERDDISVTGFDVRDFMVDRTVYSKDDSPATKKWRDLAPTVDAFILVTPEYNHSFPGELKLWLDQSSSSAYAHKPVVVAGVSSGDFGGARVIEHFSPVLTNFKMIQTGALYFPNVGTFVEMSKDQKDDAYAGRIQKTVDMFTIYHKHLSALRADLSA